MRSKSYTEQLIRAASGTHSKQKNTCAMSSIRPYHRGYRLALRDVRHATTLYIKTIDEPSSSIQAINMAADNLAVELAYLKKNAIVKNGDGSSTPIQSSADETPSTNTEDHFRQGYLCGFDRALHLMTCHAWEMNDPQAPHCIMEVVLLLENVRLEIAVAKPERFSTLRARKHLSVFRVFETEGCLT